MTRIFDSAAKLADALVDSLGKSVVVGLPVGIGKATHVVDALFARALSDPSMSLTIFTGLTLAAPHGKSDLESRFIGPIVDRLYADCATPDYVRAVADNALPGNIQVREFYLRPGAYLGNDVAQQCYASINYSQVVDELIQLGVNVITQLVAPDARSSDRFSLSSNPEITLDLLPRLDARRKQGDSVAMVGQVNRNLPYMFGDAELDADRFDFILDSDELQEPLFGLLNRNVSPADYATGMHVASLIPDGGTLQLGIGSLSDAVAHCLCLRHDSPEIFTEVLEGLPGGIQTETRQSLAIETRPFDRGLYVSTELLSDATLALFERDLIRRPADEHDDTLIHAGFFVGSNAFYQALRDMPEKRRRLINMTRISFVNTLFDDEPSKRQQRQQARFVNETMMATLLGEAASDTLANGRVVSGVGGQFDFVSMARSLEDAQSILMLRSRRSSRGVARSNVRWSCEHTTVPRHHRDIYVSEYGIANTGGKSDLQVIDAMLRIADSAFQPGLMEKAKNAHKLPADYRLPEDASGNSPQQLLKIFASEKFKRYFPEYPLGTDLTDIERQLVPALEWLQSNMARPSSRIGTLTGAVLSGGASSNTAAIERLGLDQASGVGDRLTRRLVNYALSRTN